ESRYLQRVYNTDINIFSMATALPTLGVLRGACDMFACDQETGGGDTLVPDEGGNLHPDTHQPKHISYWEQAINVGLNTFFGKLHGEGRPSPTPMRERFSEKCAPGGACGGADPTCF